MSLFDYKIIVEPLATACLMTMFNHLQYLAPELVFLLLISNSLPLAEKAEVVKVILPSTPPKNNENDQYNK